MLCDGGAAAEEQDTLAGACLPAPAAVLRRVVAVVAWCMEVEQEGR